MKKSEFKESIDALINLNVDGLSFDEKMSLVRQRILEAEKLAGFDNSNKGNSWTDEELRIILNTAPTKENCMLLARAFRRGYGSIEQIFRWRLKTKRQLTSIVQMILSSSKLNGLLKKLAGVRHKTSILQRRRNTTIQWT